MEAYKYKNKPWKRTRQVLSGPFIYMMIIPIVIMDIFLETYHRICFPLYGIPVVRRRDYVKIDRVKLSFLKWNQKINCLYCGYANGLLNYGAKIAGETERYWCGMQHKKEANFVEQPHQHDFLPYGDEEKYREFMEEKN